jgi:glycosyltransferase involved in cell wall biosynthesis
MRVSLIAPDLTAYYTVARNVCEQARFFQRRGDEIRVYLPPQPGVALERRNIFCPNTVDVWIGAKNLSSSDQDEYFARSDLYVYHCPVRYPLLESIREIERGAVILCGYGDALLADLAPYADLITLPDPITAARLVERGGCEPERVGVLPYAVVWRPDAPLPKDTELVRRYNLEGRQVVLSGPLADAEKQVDVLIQALALVKQQIPGVVLMWLGSISRDLTDAIVPGAVEDTAPYHNLADVYISLAPGDTLDISLLEAMAAGRPVIASRGPVSAWAVGADGLFFSSGEATELADCIMRVLTEDVLCGKLVRNGLARTREFSREEYTSRWARLVTQAMAWLPTYSWYTYLYPRSAQPVAGDMENNQTAEESLMETLKRLYSTADVMLRDYRVRSRLPLIGPVVAWLRRNLTSHLREPYLDPMFERQVTFNREMVRVLERIIKEKGASEG